MKLEEYFEDGFKIDGLRIFLQVYAGITSIENNVIILGS